MKSELINLITPGYNLNNALVGDEVVNFAKLNKIVYEIISNLSSEITYTTDTDGIVSSNGRLNDSQEVELSFNEIYNDYINNTIGGPEGMDGPIAIGGPGNHVEGKNNNIWIDFSSKSNHVEGEQNLLISSIRFYDGGNYKTRAEAQAAGAAVDKYSSTGTHIEGSNNYSLFTNGSHIEGVSNTVTGQADSAHIEGQGNVAIGNNSHVEGNSAATQPYYSRIEWKYNADGSRSYVQDVVNLTNRIKAINDNKESLNKPAYNKIPDYNPYLLMANIDGSLNAAVANRYQSFSSNGNYFQITEESKGVAFGNYSHVEGLGNVSFGQSSHSEGTFTGAIADNSHAEGLYNVTLGLSSHSEGAYNVSGAFAILSEDGKDITLAETQDTTPSGSGDNYFRNTYITSFPSNGLTRLIFQGASVGSTTSGSHNNSYVVHTGFQTTTPGQEDSLDTNTSTRSFGINLAFPGVIQSERSMIGFQHSEGAYNLAFGNLSHTEGFKNIAVTPGSHVEGAYNMTTIGSNHSNEQIKQLGTHIEGASNILYEGEGPIHIEGKGNGAFSILDNVHIEGKDNLITAASEGTHIEGSRNISNGSRTTHIEGKPVTIWNSKYSLQGDTTLVDDEDRHYNGSNAQYRNRIISWGPKTVWSNSVTGNSVTVPDVGAYTSTGYEYSNQDTIGENNHIEGKGIISNRNTNTHIEGGNYRYKYDTTTSTFPGTNWNRITNYYMNYFNQIEDCTNSHIEGVGNIIQYISSSHIEGTRNEITNGSAETIHMEGAFNKLRSSNLSNVHIEGTMNNCYAPYTHIEGYNNNAYGLYTHVEGVGLIKTTSSSEGMPGMYSLFNNILPSTSSLGNIIIGINGTDYDAATTKTNLRQVIDTYIGTGVKVDYSDYYEAGYRNAAYGTGAHVEGGSTVAYGMLSHAEGMFTVTNGIGSHAEGIATYTDSSSNGVHVEGIGTSASNVGAHAEGIGSNISYGGGTTPNSAGKGSHSEGCYCFARAEGAHAEGFNSFAGGDYSHSEGNRTKTTTPSAHAEGEYTEAYGIAAHAGGSHTIATAPYSFAHGLGIQLHQQQSLCIVGQYNDPSVNGSTLFVVGNGTDDNNRSNLLELHTNGNLRITNDLIFNNGKSLIDELQDIRDAISGGGSGGGGITPTSLAELTDVDISNPTNGQILIYNSTLGKWVNGNNISPTPSTESSDFGIMSNIINSSDIDMQQVTIEDVNSNN